MIFLLRWHDEWIIKCTGALPSIDTSLYGCLRSFLDQRMCAYKWRFIHHRCFTVISHEHYDISNYQQFECLFNRFFILTKKSSKLHITDHWRQLDSPHKGPVMKAFKRFSISWLHYDYHCRLILVTTNEHRDIVIHLPLACLFSSLIRLTSEKGKKLCITGLFEGNPPLAGGFPSKGQ